jgi:hypothetical protein
MLRVQPFRNSSELNPVLRRPPDYFPNYTSYNESKCALWAAFKRRICDKCIYFRSVMNAHMLCICVCVYMLCNLLCVDLIWLKFPCMKFLYTWKLPWQGSKLTVCFYSCNTRNTFDNTKLFEQRFTHSGVLIFNKLSSDIKNTGPVTNFKKLGINFLTEKSSYSVKELMTLDYQLLNCEWIRTNEVLLYLYCDLLCGCCALCAE